MTLVVVGLVLASCCGVVLRPLSAGLAHDLVFIGVPVAGVVVVLLLVWLGRQAGWLKPLSRAGVVVLAVVLVLVACGGGLAAWLGKPLTDGTLAASRGAQCPACAVDGYVHDGPMGVLGGDTVGFDHVLCADNRTALRWQAHEWTGLLRDAAGRWGRSARVEAGVATQEADSGGTARLRVALRVTYTVLGDPLEKFITKDAVFELVDDDGWRVCAVALPDVCTQLVNCAGPQSPSAVPSGRVWDMRVPWRCLPDVPYPDITGKGCPSPLADWVQPGPEYCAAGSSCRTAGDEA